MGEERVSTEGVKRVRERFATGRSIPDIVFDSNAACACIVSLERDVKDLLARLAASGTERDAAIQRAETAEKALRHEAAERKALQEWQNETEVRDG